MALQCESAHGAFHCQQPCIRCQAQGTFRGTFRQGWDRTMQHRSVLLHEEYVTHARHGGGVPWQYEDFFLGAQDL